MDNDSRTIHITMRVDPLGRHTEVCAQTWNPDHESISRSLLVNEYETGAYNPKMPRYRAVVAILEDVVPRMMGITPLERDAPED